MRSFKYIFVGSLSLIFISGCAGFQAKKLPLVNAKEISLTKSPKTKVFSRWTFVSDGSSISENVKVATAAIQKTEFEKAIKDTGCCEIVDNTSDAALIVEGTSYDESNPAAMIPAIITGLSLYTIPSWVTQEFHIKVTSTAGSKTNQYELRDSFTLVQWLPMAFAFPFQGGPIKNGEELQSNTFRNLVVNMKNDGYL